MIGTIVKSVRNIFTRKHKDNRPTCNSMMYINETCSVDQSKLISSPNEVDVGSYCIKAVTTLENNNGDLVRRYEGYNNELSILNRVENVCKFDECVYGDSRHYCTNSNILFVGPTKKCYGSIYVYDNSGNIEFKIE